MKTFTSLSLASMLVLMTLSLPAAFAADRVASGDAEDGDSRVIAYYFHGNKRCSTCLKLEQYSRETLEQKFAAELGSGTIVWQPVNFDEPDNEHFIKDFNLYTKALVLVEMKGSKRVRFRNLDRIWELVHNRDAFTRYVERSVTDFMEHD